MPFFIRLLQIIIRELNKTPSVHRCCWLGKVTVNLTIQSHGSAAVAAVQSVLAVSWLEACWSVRLNQYFTSANWHTPLPCFRAILQVWSIFFNSLYTDDRHQPLFGNCLDIP